MNGDTQGPAIIYIIAGAFGGAMEATVTWPTEYIKTKLQLQKQKLENKSRRLLCCTCASDYDRQDSMSLEDKFHNDNGGGGDYEQRTYVDEEGVHKEEEEIEVLPYTDMFAGVIYTINTLGFFALYNGLTPTLLGSMPKAGIRFGLFAWLSNALQDEDGVLSIFNIILAGIIVGIVESVLVEVPVETVKTKCIQMDLPFWLGLKEILLLEGLGGLYDGALATITKQSSNHAMRFVWYSQYKLLVTNNGEYPLTPILALFGGMTAGLFAALGNQPADVVKTRMQGVRSEYTSNWDCVRKTFIREGIPGFYTGMVPRMARVIPGQGAQFMTYEVIVALLLPLFT